MNDTTDRYRMIKNETEWNGIIRTKWYMKILITEACRLVFVLNTHNFILYLTIYVQSSTFLKFHILFMHLIIYFQCTIAHSIHVFDKKEDCITIIVHNSSKMWDREKDTADFFFILLNVFLCADLLYSKGGSATMIDCKVWPKKAREKPNHLHFKWF